jgi:predicted ATP-dependent endonuclease of OLD family
LVQDQTGLKLPIGRKGSGIQQIMLIIAYVLSSQASFVGIEELEINLAPPTQAAVFNELFRLVQSADAPIKQLFLTTHSPHLAYRNEATRRAVWLENGETRMAKPSMSEVRGFFRVPGR